MNPVSVSNLFFTLFSCLQARVRLREQIHQQNKIMVLSDFTGVGVGFGFGVGCGFGVGWGFGGMPLNVLGVGVGGGCGVGLGLGWGFGTAFGSHYRSSRLTFQGIDLDKADKREDKVQNMSKTT